MDEDTYETVEVFLEEEPDESLDLTHRFVLAGLGGVALVGDKVGSLLGDLLGPTMDRLIERGTEFENNSLTLVVKPAQKTIESAADSGRQAGRTATSTAGTVADETRKQFVVARGSVLEALTNQVEALRESVDELRATLPEKNGEEDSAVEK